MQDGYTVRRSRRPGIVGAIGLIVVALSLAGCSGGGDPQGQGGNGGGGGTASAPSPTQDPVAVNISPGANDAINPKTPIVVKADKGKLTNVAVTNPKGEPVKGSLSSDGTTWTSSELLGYGAEYKIVADATGADGKPSQKTGSVHTLAPKSTVYPSLIPTPTTGNVGVGQPIVVRFEKEIQDKAAVERALSITSTPAQTGGWYWISKKELHYRPQNYWQPGTKVSLHIGLYGLDTGGGVYGQTDRDLTFSVHDSMVAKADGNTEQMQIFRNSALVNTMPISMGKDATPTHLGAHVVSDKKQKYTMDSCTYGVCQGQKGYYRSDENWSVRISNDGEFVHENPNSVGQQGSSNVSHGCINLNAANAQWFFNNFGLGDVIEVTNSGGPALPVWDTYGDWAVPWAQWQAGSALH